MGIVVICPYCQGEARLVGSREVYPRSPKDYGMFWKCDPCGAWVGTHKNSKVHAPLGRLADEELRNWRSRAHDALDPLWKCGGMTRGEAYALVRRLTGLPEHRAHIGKMDVVECKALIAGLDALASSSPAPPSPPSGTGCANTRMQWPVQSKEASGM